MDRNSFIQAFIINFLASYAATSYDRACTFNQQESLEKLPVEDAEFLAEAAWDHMIKTCGHKYFSE